MRAAAARDRARAAAGECARTKRRIEEVVRVDRERHRVRSTIGIVCPHDAPERSGNRVTAERWRRILCELGHDARTVFGYAGEPYDVLIVLHARRGAAAARRFRSAFPTRLLVVALTGTDVYGAIDDDATAALALADRLVALQPLAIERLDGRSRAKAVTIYQSVAAA